MFDMYNCAVYLALLGIATADFNLLIIHNNDMHARFQQADEYCGLCEDDNSTTCFGGFARLHSEVVKLKNEAAAVGKSAIFLNAGDTYQGTPFYTFFKWPVVARFINMLSDLDCMSLGNHEFDDGIPGLAPFIANVSVPIVCANINTTLEPTLNLPNLTPSKVLTVNGIKIGVIGYLTPDTRTLSNTGKVEIYDEIPYIRAEAKKLKDQEVNIIIGLGHSGYQKDQEIAQMVDEIDVVVGGHSHTFLYNGTPPNIDQSHGPYPTMVRQASGKMVPVVQAFYATKYLGYLDLIFDEFGNLKSYNGSPILLDATFPQDPSILEHLHPYEKNMSEVIHSVVGYTDVIFSGSTFTCKLGECNLGNLITDAYVDYVIKNYKPSQGWTLAAIGLNQAGGIRGTIDTQHNENHNGSIVMGDVMVVLPWGSDVVMLNVTGSTLVEALEFSVTRYEETITGHVSEFLQVSGLHVVYDVNRTSGHRVVSVAVKCADCEVPKYVPLNLTQTYGVVMPEYIANGGDGFSMFMNITNRMILDKVDYLVVAEYLEDHSPIYTSVEGRISFISTTPSSAPLFTATSLMLATTVFVYLANLVSL